MFGRTIFSVLSALHSQSQVGHTHLDRFFFYCLGLVGFRAFVDIRAFFRVETEYSIRKQGTLTVKLLLGKLAYKPSKPLISPKLLKPIPIAKPGAM